MNELPKAVFSRSLQSADWQQTEVFSDVTSGIASLRQRSDKEVLVLGSSELGVSLLEQGLLDELRIMINPVVIGQGTPLFHGIKQKANVTLVNERAFRSGNVLMTYHPTT